MRLVKVDNPKVVITLSLDVNKRITEIRNPFQARHYFYLGSYVNTHQLNNWMHVNGYKIDGEQKRTVQLKGNELVKFLIKNYM